MDLTLPKPTPTTNPDPEPKPQPTNIKPFSFTNGILKRHHHAPTLGTGPFTYKECLKNHAATLGGYALDGCGEFMPAPTATPSDPTSLKCAACGCHRNFHRRELADVAATPAVIEYHSHHRHHPLPPRSSPGGGSRSHSPPPISSTYAPHMLLALSTNPADHPTSNTHLNPSSNPGKKRFRSKFSQDQKDRMHELADKVGWKMHKSNEELVNRSCREIGVERCVFKVWMHNNKNTFGKRSGGDGDAAAAAAAAAAGVGVGHHSLGFEIRTINGNDNGNGDGDGNSQSTSSHNNEDGVNNHLNHHHHNQYHVQQHRQLFGSNESNAPTNASSSSS